ncbi:MAG: LysR substrate-binding domain-containing protein [Acidobacteriota bacterium]|nr:LysR substrate-binding domain-containing protein [Acidobacteriota bacterium]
MELRLLRYFVAVAEELNVTRAAEKLHTAQPSLSQQIRQLEGIVGAPLFERDKHRLRLTQTARVLLPEAKQILAAVEMALSRARSSGRNEINTLTVAMVPGPEGTVFSRIVPPLMRAHPEIHLMLRTITSPEQIAALRKREIHLGFLRGPVDCEEIATEVFMREDTLVILPRDNPLAAKEKVSPRELSQYPLVSISSEVAPAVHDIADTIARQGNTQFTAGYNTENLLTSLNAVASGLGFCFFAEYVQDLLPKGAVARRLDLDPVPKMELLAAYHKDNCSPALLHFLRIIRDNAMLGTETPEPRPQGDNADEVLAG